MNNDKKLVAKIYLTDQGMPSIENVAKIPIQELRALLIACTDGIFARLLEEYKTLVEEVKQGKSQIVNQDGAHYLVKESIRRDSS